MGPRQPQIYGPKIQMETALVADQFYPSILEKTLMLGKTESRRRRRRQRMRWLDGIIDSLDMNLSKFWEIVEDRAAWCATVHGVAKNWTQLSE